MNYKIYLQCCGGCGSLDFDPDYDADLEPGPSLTFLVYFSYNSFIKINIRGVHRIFQRWVRARSARKIFFAPGCETGPHPPFRTISHPPPFSHSSFFGPTSKTFFRTRVRNCFAPILFCTHSREVNCFCWHF